MAAIGIAATGMAAASMTAAGTAAANTVLPYGIRLLLVSCFPPQQPQFRGIHRLLGLLKKRWGVHHYAWMGSSLTLHRRRTLDRILVSGHGSPDLAGFEGREDSFLAPQQLSLPRRSKLYLMGCHQGRRDLQKLWAQGTGLPPERIRGSNGETESALSTCLLLWLLEEGYEALDRRFNAWEESNSYLRPYFPLIRRLYREAGQQPLPTLKKLATLIDLSPVAEFLAVCYRYPQYLTELLEE